jgi:hypothetical protein
MPAFLVDMKFRGTAGLCPSLEYLDAVHGR